jgi:hypothetical protein
MAGGAKALVDGECQPGIVGLCYSPDRVVGYNVFNHRAHGTNIGWELRRIRIKKPSLRPVREVLAKIDPKPKPEPPPQPKPYVPSLLMQKKKGQRR